MSRSSVKRALAALLTCTALLVPATARATVAPAALTETVAPSSGPPTTPVTITGTGFAANEAVDVYGGTTDIALAVSDAAGAVKVKTPVPAAAQPGAYWFTLIGRHSGLATQEEFTVRTDWAQPAGSSRLNSYNRFENTLTPQTAADIDSDWTKRLVGPAKGGAAVYHGSLYLAAGATVIALDAASGALKWTSSLPCTPIGPPAVVGSVFIACTNGTVYTLRLGTGAIQLTYTQGSAVLDAPIVVTGNRVVGITRGGLIFALTTSLAVAWTVSLPNSAAGQAVAANGTYVVATGADGTALALDAATGVQAWHVTGLLAGNSEVAIAGNSAYIASMSRMECYDLPSGNLGWQIDGTGVTFSPPAIARGVVYATTTSKDLLALSAADGSTLWDTGTNYFTFAPVVAGGLVWVSTYGSKVVALDARTGAKVANVDSYTEDSPAVADGRVYVRSAVGLDVFALPDATGFGTYTRPDPARLRN